MKTWTTRLVAISGFALLAGCASKNESTQRATRPVEVARADTSCIEMGSQQAMRDTMAVDSARSTGKSQCRNQSQSGVTNKTGESTLGPGVGKATPDQGAPVTSKGDTLQKTDTTAVPRKP